MEPSTAFVRDRPAPLDALPADARRLPRRAWQFVLARRWSLIVISALALAGGGLAELRVWPPLATVMSASMAPSIRTGDVVVLKRIQQAPQVGDVLAITVPDEASRRYGYPPEVVHRVVRVSADGRIVTKGDARDRTRSAFRARRCARR